jgi:prophage regulatory protein
MLSTNPPTTGLKTHSSIAALNSKQEFNALPAEGLVREWQIIGCKRRGVPPVLPYGRSTWHNGVKSGRFPQPVHLGAATVAWRVEDIRELMAKLSRGEQI